MLTAPPGSSGGLAGPKIGRPPLYEPKSKEVGNKFIQLRVGRHTGRLYRIEIDVDALKARVVDLHLTVERLVEETEEAIDHLARMHDPKKRTPERENYRIAKNVIWDWQEEIFQSLVPT